MFVVVWVVSGWVEDGDADETACVDYLFGNMDVSASALLSSYTLGSGSESPREEKGRKGGIIVTCEKHTIRMPHLPQKPHTRRRQRIILWKLQFGWEDAAFERCTFRTLDKSFPIEEIIFGDRTGSDAIGGGCWLGRGIPGGDGAGLLMLPYL